MSTMLRATLLILPACSGMGSMPDAFERPMSPPPPDVGWALFDISVGLDDLSVAVRGSVELLDGEPGGTPVALTYYDGLVVDGFVLANQSDLVGLDVQSRGEPSDFEIVAPVHVLPADGGHGRVCVELSGPSTNVEIPHDVGCVTSQL